MSSVGRFVSLGLLRIVILLGSLISGGALILSALDGPEAQIALRLLGTLVSFAVGALVFVSGFFMLIYGHDIQQYLDEEIDK